MLITAALASCNREWVPRQSINVDPLDPALTAAPARADSSYKEGDEDLFGDPLMPCNCQDTLSQLWNYSFKPFGVFYIGPVGAPPYYPGSLFRKGAFWRSNHFVIRGGLGKSAHTVGA